MCPYQYTYMYYIKHLGFSMQLTFSLNYCKYNNNRYGRQKESKLAVVFLLSKELQCTVQLNIGSI